MSALTRHRVILGDSRRMTALPDASVHLVVTSPPYWQLKDYGRADQIGYHDSYAEYVNHLNLVWDECARVLHPGCRLCVNVGDQFARAYLYGRYSVIPIRAEIVKFCLARGLDYMGAVIWQKVTTCNTTGGGAVMGSFPYPRNGILKIDYEFILVFRKIGKAPRPTPEAKEASRLSAEEWNTLFAGHWNFPGARQHAHLAPFPEELPSRLIRMFTFVGDTVLDPFLGSGTTALAALKLGRHSVGIEINPDYRIIIEKRLADAGTLHARVEFAEETPAAADFAALVETLPYVYRGEGAPARTRDARKRSFGSSVTGREQPRDEYVRAAQVLSPSLLKLADGRTLRLAGIKDTSRTRRQARAFLEDLLAGKRLYFREEPALPPRNGELPAYLYLANRTSVNARLVKSGLVAVDPEGTWSQKARFLRYAKEVAH